MELLGLADRSLIMRLMDDYIMISTDEQAVTHFLQKIHQAFKPFGGGVNPLKTKVMASTSRYPLDMHQLPLVITTLVITTVTN